MCQQIHSITDISIFPVWKKTTWTEYERKVKWLLFKPAVRPGICWTDEVRDVHVLRPERVWQPGLLLDYAPLTTQQPGKVKPYRVSQRWDDDVSLRCLRFSPLDFVVFLLFRECQLFAHLPGTCRTVNPVCSWAVKPFIPLVRWVGCSSYLCTHFTPFSATFYAGCIGFKSGRGETLHPW